MRRQRNSYRDLLDRHQSFQDSAATSNIFAIPAWRRDDQLQSTVEIIELNSSNDVETSLNETKETNRNIVNKNHAWRSTNDEQIDMGENYTINTKARERHRQRKANNFTLPSTYKPTETSDYNNEIANSFFRDPSENHIGDEVIFNHQINCFTILNKHLIDSDTSTEEEYGDIEFIASNELMMDSNNWGTHNNPYNEEIITYDTDLDQNTGTILIYSYKNKNLISKEYFEDADIPSKMSSSSTSYSTDSSGEQAKQKKAPTRRSLGSPIPTFIPRLDLSLVPTLSTVSEGSECNMQSFPNKSVKFNKISKTTNNNWFTSKSAKVAGVKSDRKLEKSTNIINWMGLSPREKRRILKDKPSSDTWVGSRLILADAGKENSFNRTDKANIVVKNEDVTIQADVDVHADITKKIKNASVKEHKGTDVLKIDEISRTNITKYVDAACEYQKDRGDPANQIISTASTKVHKSASFTQPIDNSFQDIITKTGQESNIINIVSRNIQKVDKSESILDDASVDQVWMKNTIPFLKPSQQWSEFIPISESPGSFHLSLGSIIEVRQTWYKRLLNFLNCCK